MYLKVLALTIMSVILITGYAEGSLKTTSSLKEETNTQEFLPQESNYDEGGIITFVNPIETKIDLQEINFGKIEVSLGEESSIKYLIKVKPEWVEYWYETESDIDNIPWSENYCCLAHAMDSAKEWEQDFGNEGLYIAGSVSDFHSFNAVYMGGEVFEITNWAFIEPQNGKIIQIGSLDPYSFPIEVNLQYIRYGNRGISPTIKIIWKTNNSRGSLYTVDNAGNIIPE